MGGFRVFVHTHAPCPTYNEANEDGRRVSHV